MWNSCVQIASWIWPNGAEIWHSNVFMFICSIIQSVGLLPFSYYSTFFIEQKHGFNKETVPFFFKDRAKKLVVGRVLGTLFGTSLVWTIRNGGPNFFIYAWLVFSLLNFGMMFVYPEFIAPLFDKYSPLPDSELKRKIEALADRVGFPLTHLYVVQNSKRSSHSNAYMYGFWKNKRIVLFDTLLSKEMNELLKKTEEDEGTPKEKQQITERKDGGEEAKIAEKGANSTAEVPQNVDGEEKEKPSSPSFENEQQQKEEDNAEGKKKGNGKAEEKGHGMDDDEVVAVLGHELGHWKLGHLLMQLICNAINLLIIMFILSLFHQQENLFAAFGFPPAQQQPIAIGLQISRFVMAPYLKLFSVLMNVISRKCEFSADHFAAKLGHAPQIRSGRFRATVSAPPFPRDCFRANRFRAIVSAPSDVSSLRRMSINRQIEGCEHAKAH